MVYVDFVVCVVDFDMVEVGWELMVDGYFNCVFKVWIFEVVCEVKGEGIVQFFDYLKKGEMVIEVEWFFKGSGWLFEVLCWVDLVVGDGEVIVEGQGEDVGQVEEVDFFVFLMVGLLESVVLMMVVE